MTTGREALTDRVQVGMVTLADSGAAVMAEELGADSVWAGGHIASRNPSPEAVVWLARLVEQTRSVTVGSSILLLPLYAPAIVAKQVADLDRASRGRLVLGIGVGGEYPQEFSACQVPLAERGARTDESIPLIRRLWTAEAVDHQGRFYPMEGVRIHPAPAQPGGVPIVVSGRQSAAMRRAARVGDGWMPYMYSPRRYRESVAFIRDCAVRGGRELGEFGWMAFIPTCIDEDGERARRDAAAFLGGTFSQNVSGVLEHVGAVGTPAEVTERLNLFVSAGARHLILLPCRRDDDTQVKLAFDQVAPLVRAAPRQEPPR